MKNFSALHMATTVNYPDLRPFQWVNYFDGPRFGIEVRYTSLLDLNEFKESRNPEEMETFKNMSTLRRRDYRDAVKNNMTCRPIEDLKCFRDYFIMTMERQNISPSEPELDEMDKIMFLGVF